MSPSPSCANTPTRVTCSGLFFEAGFLLEGGFFALDAGFALTGFLSSAGVRGLRSRFWAASCARVVGMVMAVGAVDNGVECEHALSGPVVLSLYAP